MTPLVSIIVPIYNVQEDLPAALESLIEQTFNDWEAILLDDGSTDDSSVIAQTYSTRDSRFHLYRYTNHGLGAARNRGLEHVSGEYVMFFDSDDLLLPDAIQTMVECIQSTGSDIVSAIGEDFYEDSHRTRYWTHQHRFFMQQRLRTTLSLSPDLIRDHVSWAKLIRHRFLIQNGIRHPEGTIYEDVAHQTACYVSNATVDVLPKTVYLHRRRATAISQMLPEPRAVQDWITQTQRCYELLLRFESPDALRTWAEVKLSPEAISRLRIAVDLALGGTNEPLVRVKPTLHQLLSEATRANAVLPRNEFHLVGLVAAALGYGSDSYQELSTLKRLMNSGSATDEDTTSSHALREVLSWNKNGASYAELSRGIVPETFIQAMALKYISVSNLKVSSNVRELYIEGVIETSESFVWLGGSAELVLRAIDSSRVRAYPVSLRAQGGDSWNQRLQMKLRRDLSEDLTGVSWSLFLRFSTLGGVKREQKLRISDMELKDDNSTKLLRELHQGEEALRITSRRPSKPAERPVSFKGWDTSEASEEHSTIADRRVNKVLVFPYYDSNPFQNIMYLETRAQGFDVVKTNTLTELSGHVQSAISGDVLHVQWTNPVLGPAEGHRDAKHRLSSFLRSLKLAKKRGLRVAVTINNVLAHDSAYPELEQDLNRHLVQLSDAIHIMSPQTIEKASEYYRIDQAKVTHIDHPSYLGFYGPRINRSKAFELLEQDEPTAGSVLFLGHQKPYKGLRWLINGYRRYLQNTLDRDRFALLLAGKVLAEDKDEMDELVQGLPILAQSSEFVADSKVHVWLSAADLMVLPYTNILNSGSLHLAATYGVPCLLPNFEHLKIQFGQESWVHFFDRLRPEESIAEFLQNWRPSEHERKSAYEFALRRSPYNFSSHIAHWLTEVRAQNS